MLWTLKKYRFCHKTKTGRLKRPLTSRQSSRRLSPSTASHQSSGHCDMHWSVRPSAHSRRLRGGLSSLSRGSDGNVKIITDCELLGGQRCRIVLGLPATAGGTDVSQAIRRAAGVWVDNGKVKERSTSPGVRIHLLHQARQFLQRGIHPADIIRLYDIHQAQSMANIDGVISLW